MIGRRRMMTPSSDHPLDMEFIITPWEIRRSWRFEATLYGFLRVHDCGPFIEAVALGSVTTPNCRAECKEQNEPAFEVCWHCRKLRSDEDERGRRADSPPTQSSANSGFDASISVEVPDAPTTNDDNPYRPVLIPSGARQQSKEKHERQLSNEHVESEVRRALLASVVGVMLLPPLLSLYSIYVLLSLGRSPYSDPKSRRRAITAWCFNALAILTGVVFWLNRIPVLSLI